MQSPFAGSSPGGTGSASEKSATGAVAAASPPPQPPEAAAAAAAAPKPRSCVVCRQRKVRCDKQSPCANCRRADIACVLPSADRPPRWARRLRAGLGQQQQQPQRPLPLSGQDVVAGNEPPATPAADAGLVLERLRNLESLVRQLTGGGGSGNSDGDSGLPGPSGMLPGGTAAAAAAGGARAASETASQTKGAAVHEQFGRLVLDESNRSRYVSSGFWSRVNDELDELRAETASLANDESDDSDDEYWQGPATQELGRTPSERHGFLFGHNLHGRAADLRGFRPLPSQIPFLFQTYVDNVNCLLQIVHVPTVSAMVREITSSGPDHLTPGNEALMFAIYYAAVTSMEDEDVAKNFNAAKADLGLQFRLGLEYALAKADFLNLPELVVLQAFLIFLFLARRHDSPRFVWMMTGVAIRMGQALGLHRDGSNFQHMSPYDTEMRRRVWWALCVLDVRASEDQGTDLAITAASTDTKLPLHIDDSDIDPDNKTPPAPREGATSMTYSLITFEMCDLTRRMMGAGPDAAALTPNQQTHMLDEVYDKIERLYLCNPARTDPVDYWVGLTVTRMVIAKMTLILHLPLLFFTDVPDVSVEIRDRLFACAIEVAEYNHALNSEQRCRRWRWIYQTYTMWHAIVYMLVEIPRRPWGPTVERAWLALHSRFLIPPQADMRTRSMRVWIPLRTLMAKARRHRSAELLRLRADPAAAALLDADDVAAAPPAAAAARYVPLSNPNSGQLFREGWRRLVAAPAAQATPAVVVSPETSSSLSSGTPNVSPPQQQLRQQEEDLPQSALTYGSLSHSPGLQSGYGPSASVLSNVASGTTSHSGISIPAAGVEAQASPMSLMNPPPYAAGPPRATGPVPWLWADADPSADVFSGVDIGNADVDMDLEGEVNWQSWFESVRGLDQANAGGSSGREGW